jgi:hypothetical protein
VTPRSPLLDTAAAAAVLAMAALAAYAAWVLACAP